MKFRALKAHEIECRVDRLTANGAVFLLYKDARCDQNILDETVGPEKWQKKYYECKGNLYCSVGIKCGNEWIWKDDCGTESYTEKEKGEASDSFKRACVNWGIGRELYTKIFIFIKGITKDSGRKDAKGKPIYQLIDPFMKFHVSHIETDNDAKKILSLKIADEKNIEAFTWESNARCSVCGKEIEPKTWRKCLLNNSPIVCSAACLEKARTNNAR